MKIVQTLILVSSALTDINSHSVGATAVLFLFFVMMLNVRLNSLKIRSVPSNGEEGDKYEVMRCDLLQRRWYR